MAHVREHVVPEVASERPSIDWCKVNFPARLWQRDRNLFLAIAVIAILIDFVRVLPLTIYDLAFGVESGGFSLYVGAADFLMAAFLIAAYPTLSSILAVLLGSVTGVTLQALTGFPAMSGWLAMCLPWIIANCKQFSLSRREAAMLGVAGAFILSWTLVVQRGYVVPPPMQRIGWFCITEPVRPENVQVNDVVQYKVKALGLEWPMLDRVVTVEGDVANLRSDDANLEAAEDLEEGRVVELSKLHELCRVVQTWGGFRRFVRSFSADGRAENQIALKFSEDTIWRLECGYIALETGKSVLILSPEYQQLAVFEGWEVERGRADGIILHQRGTEYGESGFVMFYPATLIQVSNCNKDGEPMPDGSSIVTVRRRPEAAA